MAEDKFVSYSRSPRYMSSRQAVFRGGAPGIGGNIRAPTFLELAGPRPADEEAARARIEAERQRQEAARAAPQPALGQFQAMVPRPPGIAATVASSVAPAVASRVIEQVFPREAPPRPPVTPSGMPSVDLGVFNNPPVNLPERVPVDPTSFGYAPDYVPVDPTSFGYVPDFAPDFGIGDFAWEQGMVDVAGDVAGDAVGAGFGGFPVGSVVGAVVRGDPRRAILPTVGYIFGGPVGGFLGAVANAFLGGGDFCFITEAVMSATGGGDNAPELQVLRGFRDNVMMRTPEGARMVAEYEQLAPFVVAGIDARPDAQRIYSEIKARFIDPAVAAINAGDHQTALQLYSEMMAYVMPFAMEVIEGGGGAQPGTPAQAMDRMGSRAAVVAHDPRMAGAATGGQMMPMGMVFAGPRRY